MVHLCHTLRWRNNGRDSVTNHQPHDCLLNRLFRHRSKKTSNLRVTGLCAGNSPGTAENVSIWWRHHDMSWCLQYRVISCGAKAKPCWASIGSIVSPWTMQNCRGLFYRSSVRSEHWKSNVSCNESSKTNVNIGLARQRSNRGLFICKV